MRNQNTKKREVRAYQQWALCTHDVCILRAQWGGFAIWFTIHPLVMPCRMPSCECCAEQPLRDQGSSWNWWIQSGVQGSWQYYGCVLVHCSGGAVCSWVWATDSTFLLGVSYPNCLFPETEIGVAVFKQIQQVDQWSKVKDDDQMELLKKKRYQELKDEQTASKLMVRPSLSTRAAP